MYKVCRCINGKYFSAIPGPETVEYKLGEYVYGSDGQFLFVFDNLESAQYFTKNSIELDCVIFECEVLGLETKKPETQVIKFPVISDLPEGTRFAYGVKLTKQILENKITPFDFYFVCGREGEIVDFSVDANCVANRKNYHNNRDKSTYLNNSIKFNDSNIVYTFESWGKNRLSKPFFMTRDKKLAEAIQLVVKSGVFKHE